MLHALQYITGLLNKHLQDHKGLEENPARSLPIFLKASLVGATLLSAVYFSLVLMGAVYAPELQLVPPQEMLGFIAQKTLGPWAAPVGSRPDP